MASLTAPTLKELIHSVHTSLRAQFSQDIPMLGKSFLWVLSLVVAGGLSLAYKYVTWWSRQKFARYASFHPVNLFGTRIRPLIEIGREVGVGDPKTSTRAQLEVLFTVETPKHTLRKGEVLTSKENGFSYRVDEDTETPEPVGAVFAATVTAFADPNNGAGYGSKGNLASGAPIQLVKPITGVSVRATVSRQVTTAADAETEASYRGRVVRRRARPLQGGAYSDYEAWGEEVPGVLRCYPQTGYPGQVIVYVEADEESSGSADGIPTQAQLDAVQHSCFFDQRGRRSRSAALEVLARPIERTALDVGVFGLDVKNPVAVRKDIKRALDEYFRSREGFIVGLSIGERKDIVTAVDVGTVISEVAKAARGRFQSHKLFYAGDEIASFVATPSQKLKLGALG